MDQKSTYADGVSGAKYAQRGVAKQRASQASFLESGVDSKPSKNSYRNGVRHIAPEPSRRLCASQRARRKSVVGNDTISFADNERARRTTFVIGQRTTL